MFQLRRGTSQSERLAVERDVTRRERPGMDEVFAKDIDAIRWFSAVGDPLPAFSIPDVAQETPLDKK